MEKEREKWKKIEKLKWKIRKLGKNPALDKPTWFPIIVKIIENPYPRQA